MDFDAFIMDCRAQWPDFDIPRNLAVVEHPCDRRLAGLLGQIEGMATENKLMLLNLAVAHLADGEVYVEIGCWRGLSLAGAAFEHPHADIYACDNFSQFRGVREDLLETLKRYTAPEQVRFYDMDFRRFLDLAPWQPARVGAYFYDSGHTFEQQFQALEYMLPWLSDDAIVIVDDSNEGVVRSANHHFARGVPGFRLVTEVRTPVNRSPTWWNGMQIYRYRSSSNHLCLSLARVSYVAHHLFWDDIALPAQRVMYIGRTIAGRIPGLKPLYRRMQRLIRSAMAARR